MPKKPQELQPRFGQQPFAVLKRVAGIGCATSGQRVRYSARFFGNGCLPDDAGVTRGYICGDDRGFEIWEEQGQGAGANKLRELLVAEAATR